MLCRFEPTLAPSKGMSVASLSVGVSPFVGPANGLRVTCGSGRRRRSRLTCGPNVTMEFPCAVVVFPDDDVLALVSKDITSSKKSISANFDGSIAVTFHVNRFQTRAHEASVDRALPKRTDGRRPAN